MDPDITTPEDQAQDPNSAGTPAPTDTPAPAPGDQPASPEDEALLDPKDIEPETRGAKTQDPQPPAAPPAPAAQEDDSEDSQVIGKIVDQKMGAVSEQLKAIQKIQDQLEVDSYLKGNPQFGKFREVMIKYIAHPAYAQIPVQNIAAIVASKDLQKMGAQKEREAAQKAKETQNPGASVRKPTGSTDWSTASKEEFEAQKAKVLGQV